MIKVNAKLVCNFIEAYLTNKLILQFKSNFKYHVNYRIIINN